MENKGLEQEKKLGFTTVSRRVEFKEDGNTKTQLVAVKVLDEHSNNVAIIRNTVEATLIIENKELEITCVNVKV